jgi:hypothetical protein
MLKLTRALRSSKEAGGDRPLPASGATLRSSCCAQPVWGDIRCGSMSYPRCCAPPRLSVGQILHRGFVGGENVSCGSRLCGVLRAVPTSSACSPELFCYMLSSVWWWATGNRASACVLSDWCFWGVDPDVGVVRELPTTWEPSAHLYLSVIWSLLVPGCWRPSGLAISQL